MLTLEELVAKLRRKKVVRYEDLLVASVIKATRVETSWRQLRKMYRKDPSAWRTLERRMYSMVPARYHDAIKKPNSETRELLKKTKRAIKKISRELAKKQITVVRPSVMLDDSDEFVTSNLEVAREKAREHRTKRNKMNRSLNVIQRKADRKLRYMKALVMIAFVHEASDKRRARKFAPVIHMLISKPVPPRRWLSKATEVKLEEMVSRAGEKERAEAMKAAPKVIGGLSKTQREEQAFWERTMKAKMQWKFTVGQRVRRDKKIWPANRPVFFGTIVSQEVGEDNSGRKKPGYKVQWDRSDSSPSSFLEIELQETKSRRKK